VLWIRTLVISETEAQLTVLNGAVQKMFNFIAFGLKDSFIFVHKENRKMNKTDTKIKAKFHIADAYTQLPHFCLY
jgi:hypothetical protein